MMNKEDYVSLEVAKLLKEKGYDECCEHKYIKEKEDTKREEWDDDLCAVCTVYDTVSYPKPTLYEAQKWLWKEKQLLVTSFLDEPFAEPYQFLWSIQDAKNEIDNYGNVISKCKYDSYEEALNAGLLEALKTI